MVDRGLKTEQIKYALYVLDRLEPKDFGSDIYAAKVGFVLGVLWTYGLCSLGDYSALDLNFTIIKLKSSCLHYLNYCVKEEEG